MPRSASAPTAGAEDLRWRFEATNLEAVERWLATLDGVARSRITAIATAEDFLHDVFLDTDDRRLEATGRTLRISLRGEVAEASIEPLGAVRDLGAEDDGFSERLPDTAFAAPATAPGPVGQRLRLVCGERALTVLYETQTYRHRYSLQAGDREAGEILLDRVDVLREDARPLGQRCTVAVTAGADAASQVSAFVGALRVAGGLRTPSVRIEAELLERQGVAGVSSDASRSDAKTAGMFVAAHLRRLRRELGAWELGSRLGESPEAVHQMRVTTRRLRATLGLFASHLPPVASDVRADLEWLARALGEVRDLDVQLVLLEERRADLDADRALDVTAADLAPFSALLAKERAAAVARMIEVFDSARYRALLNDLVALAEELEGTPGPPVLAVAPALIEQRYRRVRRASRLLGPTSPPGDFHSIRIHAKRLRYATELFVEEYGRPAARLARNARRLQDALGPHQDSAVAIDYLRRFGRDVASDLPPATVFAMGVLAERQRVESTMLRRPSAIRGFGKKSWPLLLRTMRRKRPSGRSPRSSVVLEAHALGPGVTGVTGSGTDATEPMPAASVGRTCIRALEEAIEQAAPSSVVEDNARSSAVRRLVSGMFGVLG